MAEGLRLLEERWNGRRRPKAFYLVPADYSAFTATKPPKVRTTWCNNPPLERIDPAFREIPVRESKGKKSKLYDHTSTGRAI